MPKPFRFLLYFGALVVAALYGLSGIAGASPVQSLPQGRIIATVSQRDVASVAPVKSIILDTLSASPAQVLPPAQVAPTSTSSSTATGSTAPGNASVNLNLGNSISSPSQSIVIIIALTLLTVAPTLLIMLTSFTRIIIVLSLTRQALGLNTVPPNQVLAGLALFLSLFIMGPTISAMNKTAIQPYIHHQITASQAYDKAQVPLRKWMLKQTRTSDLAIFINETGKKPESPDKVSMAALVPAFILSELKTAMIIGFVIFIPFLVIDLIVSSSLMSMGMMMLPPATVSLPFKILLFVLVDGWGLVVQSLLKSFH